MRSALKISCIFIVHITQFIRTVHQLITFLKFISYTLCIWKNWKIFLHENVYYFLLLLVSFELPYLAFLYLSIFDVRVFFIFVVVYLFLAVFLLNDAVVLADILSIRVHVLLQLDSV